MKGVERNKRVAELLLKEISDLVYNRLKDPRINDITLTFVRVSRDLSVASVFFVSRSDNADVILEGLEHSAGFLRHELRTKLKMKILPQLRFFYDKSFDYGEKMDSIIDKLDIKSDVNKSDG